LLALLTGRRTRAAALVEAWAWNLAHPLRLRADHAAVQSHRVVRDRDLRRLQTRASAGLGALLHGRLDDGRRFAPSAGSGPWAGGGALVVLAVALLLTFGTRGLLGSRLPSVGAMVPLASWHRLLAQYLSGWRSVGIGSGLAPPLAFPMLGVAGAVSGGSMGLLSQLLYLGGLPLGAIGAWRLGAFAGSRRARWVMLVAWLVVPLPYDALSRGQWQTVVAFGAMPFFLRRLLELTGLAPFGGRGAHAAAPSHSAGAGSMARLRAHAPDLRAVVVLGLLLALVSGLVPPERAVLLVAAAALCLGTLATARPRAALRLGLGALGAVVVADLADLPQSVAVVANGGPWPALVGLGGTSPPSLSGAALAHLALGSAVRSPLSWGLLAAGAVCLVVARGERRGWALRLWTLAVGSLAVAWGAGRAGLGVPDDGIFLVPMGAALALCAGLGWAAFEEDLPRYRFGWRQLVSAVAGVGLAAAALPVLAAAGGGRWGLPSTGVDRVLSWMPTGGSQGQFRVLWVAPPALLPLQGWTLSTGMAYATSTDGPPDAAGLWPGAPGPARALAGAVREAVAGRTVELGHLLAPLAVRYVVVPLLSSPGTEVSAPPTPARERAVTGALSRQLDLRQLQSDPSLVVYQNLSWSPGRAMLTPAAAASASGPWPAAPQATDLSGSRAVLRTPPGATSAAGTLRPGQLLVSVPFRSGWELRGPGGNLRPREAFGVVERFALSTAGRYHLAHSPPAGYLASIWAEAVLWLLALAALWRPRSRSSRAAEQSQIAATLPLPRPVGAVAVPAPEPVAEQAR
ncbi:MAG: hypothetical protein ACRDYD_01120, partial [Acidimicrobiales bacterium]